MVTWGHRTWGQGGVGWGTWGSGDGTWGHRDIGTGDMGMGDSLGPHSRVELQVNPLSPLTVPSGPSLRQEPKSPSRMWPQQSRRMLSGLMSLGGETGGLCHPVCVFPHHGSWSPSPPHVPHVACVPPCPSMSPFVPPCPHLPPTSSCAPMSFLCPHAPPLSPPHPSGPHPCPHQLLLVSPITPMSPYPGVLTPCAMSPHVSPAPFHVPSYGPCMSPVPCHVPPVPPCVSPAPCHVPPCPPSPMPCPPASPPPPPCPQPCAHRWT